jgi:hypothetical protein
MDRRPDAKEWPRAEQDATRERVSPLPPCGPGCETGKGRGDRFLEEFASARDDHALTIRHVAHRAEFMRLGLQAAVEGATLVEILAQAVQSQRSGVMAQGRIHRAIMVAGTLLALAFSAPLVAQTLYGTLVGNITDPSGLAVVGATVRAEHSGTGLTRETKTNERGAFVFSDLQGGAYNLIVVADSFAPLTRTGLQISANAVTRADAQLELPNVAEAVTVAASAVVLQTDRAEVRSEIDSNQVNSLPVSGVRNYTALLALVPGVSPPQSAHSLAANPQESLAASVGGQSDERNDTRIDGAGNTSSGFRVSSPTAPRLKPSRP